MVVVCWTKSIEFEVEKYVEIHVSVTHYHESMPVKLFDTPHPWVNIVHAAAGTRSKIPGN